MPSTPFFQENDEFFYNKPGKVQKSTKTRAVFVLFFANAYPSNSQGTKVKDTSQGLWR